MNGEAFIKAFGSIDLSKAIALKKDIIIFIMIIAASVFAFRLFYAHDKKAIAMAELEIRTLKEESSRVGFEIKATEGLNKALSEATAERTRLEGRLKGIKERLPSDKRISRIIADVTGADETGGVKVSSVKPLEPENKGEVTRIPLHMVVEAGFIPFGRYLETIDELRRIIIVDNFMIEQKEETGQVLNVQLYLSAYLLNK